MEQNQKKDENWHSNKWITKESFSELEPGDRLKVRRMKGTAIVQQLPSKDDDISVTFKDGPWDGRSLNLIRNQISKIL